MAHTKGFSVVLHFLVTLQATESVLAHTKGFSVVLQGRYRDIARAYSKVETLKSAMKCLLSKEDLFHAQVYCEAKKTGTSCRC